MRASSPFCQLSPTSFYSQLIYGTFTFQNVVTFQDKFSLSSISSLINSAPDTGGSLQCPPWPPTSITTFTFHFSSQPCLSFFRTPADFIFSLFLFSQLPSLSSRLGCLCNSCESEKKELGNITPLIVRNLNNAHIILQFLKHCRLSPFTQQLQAGAARKSI